MHQDVDVSPEAKQAMGDDWEFIGWESSEQLACRERKYFVRQIRRAKYVLKHKKTNTDDKKNAEVQADTAIKVAPFHPVMLPRAIADTSLLAKILTGKLVDAFSFNRECKVSQREGIARKGEIAQIERT